MKKIVSEPHLENPINETTIFEYISKIIEDGRLNTAAYTNCEVNIMFWEIGRYINSAILDFKRAPYGKKIFSTLSRKLAERYGKSFQEENAHIGLVFSTEASRSLIEYFLDMAGDENA